MAIIPGTNENDVLVGTGLNDAINGFGGDDILEGLAGADILNGGQGFDAASYSSSATGVTVNLTAGEGSGGDAEGDLLFSIEGIEGSNFNDDLIGNSRTNYIDGGAGNDTIHSGANTPGTSDTLIGGDGNDTFTIVGDAHAFGGSGDDRIIGLSTGTIDNDFAVARYDLAASGIIANLTVSGGDNINGYSVADGDGGSDLISGVHAIQDSAHDDQFSVDGTYQSSFGNQIEVRLGAGNDHVTFTGVERGRVSWRNAEGGVRIDMANGTAEDMNEGDIFIGTDTFTGANQARGTRHDDLISGSDANERLQGDEGNDAIIAGGGDDTLYGGGPGVSDFGGDDYLEGGAGADTVDGQDGFDVAGYRDSATGVTVNLGTGAASGGDAQGDTLFSIEGLTGSDHADNLTGDASGNSIEGGAGADFLHGGGVTTRYDFDSIDGGDGNDTITIVGLGSAIGGAGDDRIIGQWSGAPDVAELDYISAEYWDATTGIVANLTGSENGGLSGGDNTAGFLVSDGQGGTDTVSGIHVFTDSDHDDTFHVDSTYLVNFGTTTVNWIEIGLAAGNDSVTATGVQTAGVNYSNAQGGVLLDLTIGTATDINPSDSFIGNDSLNGINRARGTSFDDDLYGSANNEQFRGRWGDDLIDGRGGNDALYGDERSPADLGGNDTLIGGEGFDTIWGGGGDSDTAVFNGLDGAGHLIYRFEGVVYALDRTDQSYDTIQEVEFFSDGFQIIALDQIYAATDGDALDYAASYDDLALAFRTNADAALSHYLNSGFFEGREITFDAAQYLANWTDLASAFGSDVAAARNHFLLSGVDEHRLAEDPLDYIASYADLTNAFAGLTLEQTRAAGLSHYQGGGWSEGRRNGIDFDAEQYLENNADVAAAFGGDDDLAAWHFINAGRNEGRMWEDPLEYIATFGDLIAAFGSGSEAEIRAAGLAHFRNASSAEQDARRAQIDFDADQYLANYADLRAAFADGQGGYDENQATLHFIRSGFSEGRTDDVLVA